jgi:copper chaperone
MKKLIASVTGLTCQHCVNTVTETLEAVDGIDRVAVDLVNGGESTLTIDASTPDDLLATIAQALATEGYTLTSVSAGEN